MQQIDFYSITKNTFYVVQQITAAMSDDQANFTSHADEARVKKMKQSIGGVGTTASAAAAAGQGNPAYNRRQESPASRASVMLVDPSSDPQGGPTPQQPASVTASLPRPTADEITVLSSPDEVQQQQERLAAEPSNGGSRSLRVRATQAAKVRASSLVASRAASRVASRAESPVGSREGDTPDRELGLIGQLRVLSMDNELEVGRNLSTTENISDSVHMRSPLAPRPS